ncbi:MAG TPA: 2,3-dihydro-2,3-dihydroxybenzoate dehydrogenase [Micromonosporaceae bacterium]|nr:2,3-dihydro-2,3-dihydroxybenzoate dehydrogenase [Micromonosporaceae bacterium]
METWISAGIADRVALVTGAARGIGAAVAHSLSDLGARVACVDIDAEALRETGAGHPYPADVTDAAAVERVLTAVEADLGPIDIAVNVAGILRTGDALATADDDWAALFAVNTTGVFHVSRFAARRMVPRRRGVIVTVGSNAAGVPRAGMAAYAASKAAAAHFTRSLGLELAPHGIRCNVVAPGSTDTDMQRAMWTPGGPGAEGVIAGDPAAFKVGIPLGRIAAAEDIADAVTFLVSDRARHITLHDLYVDGGATLRA